MNNTYYGDDVAAVAYKLPSFECTPTAAMGFWFLGQQSASLGGGKTHSMCGSEGLCVLKPRHVFLWPTGSLLTFLCPGSALISHLNPVVSGGMEIF